MKIAFVYTRPIGFKIRSKQDALQFVTELVSFGSADFPDLNNPKKYYCIMKAPDGRTMFGSAHYGKDPITAEPLPMSDKDLVERVYLARKSINARFFDRTKD